MINLLKLRTDVAKEIGDIKNELGITVTNETRESELREKIIAECNTLNLDESIGTDETEKDIPKKNNKKSKKLRLVE